MLKKKIVFKTGELLPDNKNAAEARQLRFALPPTLTVFIW